MQADAKPWVILFIDIALIFCFGYGLGLGFEF